jgi:integrase
MLEMTCHSFSPVASAVLHEEGWLSDFIEHQLAHAERNIVKAVYNHARHLPEHTKMLQWWEFGIEREDK